ncbi:MAG: TIGR01244 family phosphatase [Proteobacteria bacterium]|nr:TIGR01244 family phosphatase [Pseudomonadota bacterium]
MRVIQLSDSFSVSDQIAVEDVAKIAQAGFKVLINNRPDYEEPNQPGSDQIASAAEKAGMQYYYLPVTARNFPGLDLNLLAGLINNPEVPTLAFCRSGTRCTNLWVATHGEEQRDASVAVARQLGYDLSMALVH